jgi:hypothetical protein
MGIDNTAVKVVSSDRYQNPGHDRRVFHVGSSAMDEINSQDVIIELTGTYTDAYRVFPINCFDNF